MTDEPNGKTTAELEKVVDSAVEHVDGVKERLIAAVQQCTWQGERLEAAFKEYKEDSENRLRKHSNEIYRNVPKQMSDLRKLVEKGAIITNQHARELEEAADSKKFFSKTQTENTHIYTMITNSIIKSCKIN